MKKNYRDSGPLEHDRGQKRYIERLIEDREAEEQIKHWEEEQRDDDQQEQIQDNLR